MTLDLDAIEAIYRPRKVYDQTGRDIFALIARVRELEDIVRHRESRLQHWIQVAEVAHAWPTLGDGLTGPELPSAYVLHRLREAEAMCAKYKDAGRTLIPMACAWAEALGDQHDPELEKAQAVIEGWDDELEASKT